MWALTYLVLAYFVVSFDHLFSCGLTKFWTKRTVLQGQENDPSLVFSRQNLTFNFRASSRHWNDEDSWFESLTDDYH